MGGARLVAEKDKEIDGYSSERIGAAVRKLRVSQGLLIKVLSHDADVSHDTLSRFETGKRTLPENAILRLSAVLGTPSVQSLMEQADATPEISKVSATKAIVKIAKLKNVSLAEIERKAELADGSLSNFINIHGAEGLATDKFGRGVETLYFAAKALGFKSLGGLIQAADKLPDDLNAEIYKQEKPEQTINGFSVKRVGEAIEKMRISQGKAKDTLAQNVEVSADSISELRAGNKALSDVNVLKVANALGFPSVSHLVAEAEQLPEITKSSVANAIHRICKHRGITPRTLADDSTQLNPNALERFVAARNNEENPYLALETAFRAAKPLGFDSLGGLVAGAAKLNSQLELEEYQTQSFKHALKALQHERRMTASDMAGALGIKPAAYEHIISKRDNARIPIPVLEKLPGILGVPLDKIATLGNSADITAEAAKVAKPAFGHWTSLVDASRITEKVLAEKAEGRKL